VIPWNRTRPNRDEREVTGAMRVADLFQPAPDADSEEQIWLGCPMLKKLTYQPKRGRKRVTVMRCALGYALNTPEAIDRCRQTPGPHRCWQCQEQREAMLIRDPEGSRA